jgi:hypothetical protein
MRNTRKIGGQTGFSVQESTVLENPLSGTVIALPSRDIATFSQSRERAIGGILF